MDFKIKCWNSVDYDLLNAGSTFVLFKMGSSQAAVESITQHPLSQVCSDSTVGVPVSPSTNVEQSPAFAEHDLMGNGLTSL